MTNEKSDEKSDKKSEATAPAKKTAAKEKLILYEAVQKHQEKNYIIIGALASAGLLAQYKQEESTYGIEDIPPSITMDELDKLIKKFLGE